MTLRCASTFLRNNCRHPAGHDGNHCHRDSSGHTTVWDDAAADLSTLLAAKQSETDRIHFIVDRWGQVQAVLRRPADRGRAGDLTSGGAW